MICTCLICSSCIIFEVNTKQLLAKRIPLLGHTTLPSSWELPCGFTVPFLRVVAVPSTDSQCGSSVSSRKQCYVQVLSLDPLQITADKYLTV